MMEQTLTGTERKDKAEKSIIKKFRKELFSKFTKAIKTYRLIEDGDRIAVCISGGKDSMLMAKLFQELLRHGEQNFTVKFLVMDPGYNADNRALIEANAALLDIPVTIFDTDIFGTVEAIPDNPCYLCARMRRGNLYAQAKALGCNKIALGHHYDDVIETILMSMLHSGQVQTMMPKLHSTNFEGMQLIRPLYLVREEDIIRWATYNDLHFLRCACKLTADEADGIHEGKRLETKALIRELKEKNPYVEGNIFKSMENVHLATVVAYKDAAGVRHHFLDDY